MTRYIASIKRFLPVIAALSLLAFPGCIRDDFSIPTPSSAETWGDFNLKVPGIQTPLVQTRGMDGAPETDVRTLMLVVLEKSSVDGKYYYKQKVNLSKSNGDYTQTGSSISFKAKLENRSNNSMIIFLANTPDIALWDGYTKKNVMNELDYENAAGKWNVGAADGTGFVPIPMYGEKEIGPISPAMDPITDLFLTRMVARIDISNEADNFILESVSHVNYYSRSKICPPNDDDGNLIPNLVEPITDWQPHLYFKGGWDNRLEYTFETGETAKIGEIYTFETRTTDDSFLIVKGKMGDESSPSTYYRVNFAVPKGTDPYTLETMPIWRNHFYDFTISAVTGAGYATYQEAIDAHSMVSNMETRLFVYDQSRLGSIVYDGQYMMGAGQEEVTYPYTQYNAEVVTVPVYTNYPAGWKAVVTEGTEWLYLTRWSNEIGDWVTPYFQEDTGVADDHQWQQVAIVIPEAYTVEGGERKGKIRLTSGRLSMDITVTQKGPDPTATPTLDIILVDENGNELSYDWVDNTGTQTKEYKMDFGLNVGGRVPPKRIYAKTTGAAGYAVIGQPTEWITEIDGINSFLASYPDPNPNAYPLPTWRQVAGGNWDGAPYYYTPLQAFDIEPLPGSDNKEYWDRYNFTAFTEGWATQLTVFLKIYQGDWIIITDFNTEKYLLGSISYLTKIRANAEWEIAKITETRTSETNPGAVDRFLVVNKSDAGYLKVGQTGGSGATTQNPLTTTVNLTTAQWLKGLEGTVTVEFKSRLAGNRPNKAFSFEVYEHHLDYTSASTKTPLMYTFPINLPRTSASGSVPNWTATNWSAANKACQSIAPGWRLPTLTESFLFSIYRPALVVAREKWDPYAKQDSGYTDGWFYYQYWSLGVRGTNYATMNPYNGYSWYYAPAVNQVPNPPDPDQWWLMARCVYTQWGSNSVNPTFDASKLPNTTGQYYPYIDTNQSGGPVIVSRNGNNGVNSEAIGSPSGIGDIYDETRNVVPAKLQVAPTDLNANANDVYTRDEANDKCASTYGNGWRLPTQKELLLIFALGGTEFHSESHPNGFAKLSNTTGMGTGFTPLVRNTYNYWTSSTDKDGQADMAWTMTMNYGTGRGIPPNVKGGYTYTNEEGQEQTINIGGARCVRTFP